MKLFFKFVDRFQDLWKVQNLLSGGSRSNNYVELSKKNVLGNMMQSHWPCSTWMFFMTWFHKTLKLIFQKQSSCPRNMCTEHWRNPPIFTYFLEIFSYLKNNDSMEHMLKVLLTVLFIYFHGKAKVSHYILSI